jgi:hypothetical protein
MIQLKGGNGKRLLLVALMTVGLFMVVSCTASQQQRVYHGLLMKGSIIHTTDDGVYLCVGSRDGAQVGQELDVYKMNFSTPKKTATRKKTGKVKITEIVDEHFATATIISGKAEKNDIVELEN